MPAISPIPAASFLLKAGMTLAGWGVLAGTDVASAAGMLEWLSPELRRIEESRSELEGSLTELPVAPGLHPSERLGWHSDYSASPNVVEWVDLKLNGAHRLDAIVLIAPPPGGGTNRPGYGFPRRFRVELMGSDGGSGSSGIEEEGREIIADFTDRDFSNPGLLPVCIPAGGRQARIVRITATRLYTEGGRSFCALGEVMLLQGKRNLGPELEAIGPVQVRASSSMGTRPDWGRINLVDGQTVLGPPQGNRSSPTAGYRSKPQSESRGLPNPWVMVDLGDVMPVDEVRLFPAHPPEFAHRQGYGFPVRYHLELSLGESELPEFLNTPESGSYMAPPGDNVVTLPADGRRARFVRLNVDEPHVSNGSAVLALAELQVWSGGQNVALAKPVTAAQGTEEGGWSKEALVDGFTSLANIVDWPEWLAGLSRRREVEQEMAALAVRRATLLQQWRRTGLLVLGGGIVAALAMIFLWSVRLRQARRAELEALRQRISQDLHDEIGSSLGSIALISQDAMALAHDEPLRRELAEIRDTAQQTLDSMRDIVRLVQSGVYGQGDLTAHLQEIAGRMLRGMPHTMEAEAAEAFNQLPVNQRRDLVLIFKEALHNLLRHAEARHAKIALAAGQGWLTLTVADDGRGFEPGTLTEAGMGLTNLQRRAAKHGGSASISSAPQKGTIVTIKLPRHV